MAVGAIWSGGSDFLLLVDLVAGPALGFIGIVLAIIGTEKVVETRSK